MFRPVFHQPPQSTKLALSAFRCLRRSKPLRDMLEKRAKQGSPLGDLDLRTLTCVAAERAAQLLVMFVDNVQGPAEMLLRGYSAFRYWKGGVDFFDNDDNDEVQLLIWQYKLEQGSVRQLLVRLGTHSPCSSGWSLPACILPHTICTVTVEPLSAHNRMNPRTPRQIGISNPYP